MALARTKTSYTGKLIICCCFFPFSSADFYPESLTITVNKGEDVKLSFTTKKYLQEDIVIYKNGRNSEHSKISWTNICALFYCDVPWEITFTFNNLADVFIQRYLQMRRAIKAIKPTIVQQYTRVVTSPS